jgi:hypothetical protein
MDLKIELVVIVKIFRLPLPIATTELHITY